MTGNMAFQIVNLNMNYARFRYADVNECISPAGPRRRRAPHRVSARPHRDIKWGISPADNPGMRLIAWLAHGLVTAGLVMAPSVSAAPPEMAPGPDSTSNDGSTTATTARTVVLTLDKSIVLARTQSAAAALAMN